MEYKEDRRDHGEYKREQRPSHRAGEEMPFPGEIRVSVKAADGRGVH